MASAFGLLNNESQVSALKNWAGDRHTVLVYDDNNTYEVTDVGDEQLKKLNQFLEAQKFTKAGRRNN